MITAITGVTAMSGITAISNPLSDITRIGAPLSTTTTVSSYNMGSTGYLTSTFDSSTIGTGDISVSCWVKTPTAYDSVEYIWVLGNDDLTDSLALRVITSKLQIIGQVGGGGVSGVIQWNPLLPDQWTHVVVTRTGTSINIYINGTNYYYSSHANFGADLSGGETWVGYQGGARSFNGDIANIEVRNAVLTASEIYNNFRSNTAYTTGTAQDLGISLNGDATESVSPIPLGWSNKHSFYLDGVNDYIKTANATAINVNGDLTISCWVKRVESGVFQGLVSKRDASGVSYQFFIRDTNYLSFYNGSVVATDTGATIPVDEWVQVAVVSNATQTIFYIDGVQSSIQAAAVVTSSTSELYIGAIRTTSTLGSYLEGFIDEAYIFNSDKSSDISTIYNADTPSDVTSLGDVVYYLHEGTGADWSGNNIAALLQSGATASSDVPVLTIPDWVLEHSLDFNGTDQYGVIKDAAALSFGDASTDSPFSGAAWVYFDVTSGFRIFSKISSTNSDEGEYLFGTDGSSRLRLWLLDSVWANQISINTTSTSLFTTAQWYHVAFTYDGTGSSGFKLYVNGVEITATTTSSSGSYSAMHNTGKDLEIGRFNITATTGFSDGKIASAGIWSAELDADAMLFLAQNPAHDLNTDSGDYDYSSDIVAAHAIETGFGPYVIDYSGNGHHATAPAGAAPTWSTDVPNLFRNIFSVDFDGTNDYVAVDGLVSDVSSNTTGTFLTSIKPVDATPTGSQSPWSYGDDNGNEALFCYISTAGDLVVNLRVAGTNQWVFETDVAPFSDNTWANIAIVHDGVAPVLYINGSSVSITFTTSTNKTAWLADLTACDVFRIGALRFYNSSDFNLWNGKIDEFAYFNSNLSSAQISSIHDGTTVTDLSSYSPITWLRMGDNDGGTGTTVTDQGSGGNDGTLTNGPTFSTDTPS